MIITASHNPEQWNGMKFVNREGAVPVAGRSRPTFRRLVKANAREVRRVGRPAAGQDQNPNAIYAHINSILSNELFRGIRPAIIERKLKVGVDAVNGAASVAACQLVEALGARAGPAVLRIEPMKQGAKFPRSPSPWPQNLGDLCNLVTRAEARPGHRLRPGRRPVQLRRRDRRRRSAKRRPSASPASTCCPGVKGRSWSTSRRPARSTTSAPNWARPVERTPVGEANVADRMEKVQAVLGGEGNGGVILPELNFTRDGLVAAATVIGLLSQGREPLSAIGATLPRYQMVKTSMTLTREQFAERDEKLVRAFEGAQVDRQDGLKFSLEDSWVHVRPVQHRADRAYHRRGEDRGAGEGTGRHASQGACRQRQRAGEEVNRIAQNSEVQNPECRAAGRF